MSEFEGDMLLFFAGGVAGIIITILLVLISILTGHIEVTT